MNDRLSTIGAKGLGIGLRAFFCFCLLLSTIPAFAVTKTSSKSADGMGTPPPALLEPQTRFGAFGGLERRFLGALPVASSLWITARVQRIWSRPKPVQPVLRPSRLAEMQQWRLEGG